MGSGILSVRPEPIDTGVFRDEAAVASIADSTRRDPETSVITLTRAAQPSKDSENRVRLYVDRMVFDQNNAGQFSASNVVFEYCLASR